MNFHIMTLVRVMKANARLLRVNQLLRHYWSAVANVWAL